MSWGGKRARGEERSTGRQVGAGRCMSDQGSSCPTGFSRFQRNTWCSYQCMGLCLCTYCNERCCVSVCSEQIGVKFCLQNIWKKKAITYLFTHQTFIKCPSCALQNGAWPWREPGLCSVSYSLCAGLAYQVGPPFRDVTAEGRQSLRGRPWLPIQDHETALCAICSTGMSLSGREACWSEARIFNSFSQGFCGETVTGSAPKSRLPWHAEVDFYCHPVRVGEFKGLLL